MEIFKIEYLMVTIYIVSICNHSSYINLLIDKYFTSTKGQYLPMCVIHSFLSFMFFTANNLEFIIISTQFLITTLEYKYILITWFPKKEHLLTITLSFLCKSANIHCRYISETVILLFTSFKILVKITCVITKYI